MLPLPPSSPLFPYTTLFRSISAREEAMHERCGAASCPARRISSTVSSVPSRVEPPAPKVHEKKRGLSRSEEHTSELQSPCNLVCRLLLEKKNKENKHKRKQL